MLHLVQWQLISWMGRCSYTVELSPEEKKELEAVFMKWERDKKLAFWSVAAIDIKGLEDIRGIVEQDIREMDE